MIHADLTAILEKDGPMTRGEIAVRTGYSYRHIGRILKNIEGVHTEWKGREMIYSAAAASSIAAAAASSAASSASSSITTAQPDVGHDLGQMSYDRTKMSYVGHDLGQNVLHNVPSEGKNSKQRHRNRKRTPIRHGQPQIGAQSEPRSGVCKDEATPLCPMSYAEFERDFIQFVLVDRVFRDILVARAEADGWQVRNSRGHLYIRIQDQHLSLQVDREVITFSSDDPGDLSGIARWIRKTFTGSYRDIDSLVLRIRNPQNLTGEELTVVIRHPETVTAIRSTILSYGPKGEYNLPSPNENTPGTKVYESRGTIRVEFVIHNHAQAVAALNMKSTLIGLLPRIHQTPGVFWEFIQKYYSPVHHPIFVDTGGHVFVEELHQDRETLKFVVEKFTELLKLFAPAIQNPPPRPVPVPATASDQSTGMKAEVEALDRFEIEDVIGRFAKKMKLEREAVLVYLAAFSIWQHRNFRARVLKEDIWSLLQKEQEPVSMDRIAAAIEALQGAGLMVRDPHLEVRFSADGWVLGKKMLAKTEGV